MFKSKSSKKNYFTIEAIEDNTPIYFLAHFNTKEPPSFNYRLEYSEDEGKTWTEYIAPWPTREEEEAPEPFITLNSGDKVLIRSENTTYYDMDEEVGASFSIGDHDVEERPEFYAYGNIMSLIGGENFEEVNTVPDSCFSYFFESSNIKAKAGYPLLLPATNLGAACYEGMFSYCTALTSAPELPAATLANYCYCYMFEACESLVKAPELPATILAEGCYSGMFQGCFSLETAPELPATTLVDYCYSSMFDGCGALNYIKCLATDISATMCTSGWVESVSPTGTFVRDPNMTDWVEDDVDGIPENWETIPPMPPMPPLPNYLTFKARDQYGTTLFFKPRSSGLPTVSLEVSTNNGKTWSSYTFDSSSVNAVPIASVSGRDKKIFIRGDNTCLGRNEQDIWGFGYSFISTNNVYVSGNIMSLLDSENFESMTSAPDYAFPELFYSTIGSGEYPTSINIDPDKPLLLPATSVGKCAYDFMFKDCRGLTTAPELPALNIGYRAYDCMFLNCTGLTTAPQLPSVNLSDGCYAHMFDGCTSLVTAPNLPANTMQEYCYEFMFKGCTSLTNGGTMSVVSHANMFAQSMFSQCTSLNRIKNTDPSDNRSSYNYYNWMNGAGNGTGTFIKSAASNWQSGASGIPTGWTVVTE